MKIVKEVIDKGGQASRKLALTAAAGAGVVDITLPVAICSRGVYHGPEQSRAGGRVSAVYAGSPALAAGAGWFASDTEANVQKSALRRLR